jgi:hypothetical protein
MLDTHLAPILYSLTNWQCCWITHVKNSTLVYPQPVESSPYPPSPICLRHLNIIVPSKPKSYKWSLSFRFSSQNHFPPLPGMQNILLMLPSLTSC